MWELWLATLVCIILLVFFFICTLATGATHYNENQGPPIGMRLIWWCYSLALFASILCLIGALVTSFI